MAKANFSSRRYLGLELSGAKNQKTTLAILEFYPKEKKVFLLDTMGGLGDDQRVLEAIGESGKEVAAIGVNVPLQLPPCLTCTPKSCSKVGLCRTPAAKWMREWTKKNVQKNRNFKEPTPYTQRPIEIWVKYQVLAEVQKRFHFDIDETLGGNRAPLAARMVYLKKYIEHPLFEIWPKLTVALLAKNLDIHPRYIENYRKLEEGSFARGVILEALAQSAGVFIYEKDLRKISQSLNCFDAFICAFTSMLSDIGKCSKPPRGFPVQSGWVQYPADDAL